MNDEKDRHVVAAALEAEALIIVTANLDDFTPLPAGMHAISPDDFLCELFERAPGIMLEVIAQQVADFKRPPVTHAGLLDHLAKQVPLFVTAIKTHQQTTWKNPIQLKNTKDSKPTDGSALKVSVAVSQPNRC